MNEIERRKGKRYFRHGLNRTPKMLLFYVLYIIINQNLWIIVIKCKQINSTYDSDISASTSSAYAVYGIQFVQVCLSYMLWNYNNNKMSAHHNSLDPTTISSCTYASCFEPVSSWVHFVWSIQLEKKNSILSKRFRETIRPDNHLYYEFSGVLFLLKHIGTLTRNYK